MGVGNTREDLAEDSLDITNMERQGGKGENSGERIGKRVRENGETTGKRARRNGNTVVDEGL